MADETIVSSEISVTKHSETTESADIHHVEVTKEDLNHLKNEGKKGEEETVFDGEFIKVEKDSFESKEAPREFFESKEKIKELELELEKVIGALKHSESENIHLKNEISLTNNKFDEILKRHEDLELNHKKLKEHSAESDARYTLEFNTLQESLKAQEKKHTDSIKIKEALEGLRLELESSKKMTQELEDALQQSTDKAVKFEELHKKSCFHAESETNRALELEKMLELADNNAKEVVNQVDSLQVELKGLYDKIVENNKVEETLTRTVDDLYEAQEELKLSKSSISDIKQKLFSKETILEELNRDLDGRKASESQLKSDISALESLFAAEKAEFKKKVADLEMTELKLKVEVSLTQEEVAILTRQKQDLEAVVLDLNTNVTYTKELYSDLQSNLKVSDENFGKTDLLLSQALTSNAELELRLKSFEEHRALAAISSQKNIELEDTLEALNAALEEAKSQLREFETCFINSEQKNIELDRQLNLVALKSSDFEREVSELTEKLSERNSTLNVLQEENHNKNGQLQEFEEKVTLLESAVIQSNLRNSELEIELKSVEEKITDHEDKAKLMHQHRLELEDLYQASHSKVQHTSQEISGLNLLLEVDKHRIQELEEQVNVIQYNSANFEAESKKLSDKVSELEAELKVFQAKSSTLEHVIQLATEKESELLERLNVTTNENKLLNDMSNESERNIAEAEKLFELLQVELNLTKEKLEHIENDMKTANARESELKEKLISSDLKYEQATVRSIELELLHESVLKDSDVRLQEAISNFTHKDSEAQSLYERLEERSVRLASHESANEELTKQISAIEDKAAQSLSENEILIYTNTQLKKKIQELQEILDSVNVEKEFTFEKYKIEVEEKILRVKNLEELLEEVQNKLSQFEKESEGLAGAKLKLTQELVEYESKDNVLRAKLVNVLAEKDVTVEQLHSSKIAIENLTQQMASAEQKLQSQENVISQKVMEAEASVKNTLLQELEAKNKQVAFLQEQVRELDHKLQSADYKSNEKCEEDSKLVVNSRDIGLKRKGKNNSEENRAISDIARQLKFVLGVALVSIIVGIILGKRY